MFRKAVRRSLLLALSLNHSANADAPEAEPNADTGADASDDEPAAYDLSFGSTDDSAQQEFGPELAVRTGLSVGSGDLTDELGIRDRVSAIVPLVVDVGYRHDRWFFGAYGQFGFGINSATSDATCPKCLTTPVRLGLQLQYVAWRASEYALWAGLGAGVQQLNTNINDENKDTERVSGWEYAMLQLGSTWAPLAGVTVGPYSSLSFGNYDTLESGCLLRRCGPLSESELSETGLGVWFTTGLRVTLLP